MTVATGPARIVASAAKGALVGAVELGVLWAGIMLFVASVENADNVEDAIGNALIGLVIWLPLLLIAVVGAGLLAGWLTRLPMWFLVVPLANVAGVAALQLPGESAVRAAAVVAVFAAGGALAAALRPDADAATA